MKKKRIVLFLFVLILIIGICFGCYLIISKLFTNSSEEEKSKDKEEIVDYSVANTIGLLDKFGFYTDLGCESNIFSYKYDDTFKVLNVLNSINDSEEVACSEVFSEDMLNEDVIGGLYPHTAYKGTSGVCFKDQSTKMISYDKANEIYQKMYGKVMPKTSVSGIDISNMYYVFYDYVESKNAFVSMKGAGLGGMCGNSLVINDIKSSTLETDLLTVDVYYYYDSNFQLNNNQYSLKNKSVDCLSSEECIKNIKDEYLDDLDIYELEFKKVDDDFIFKGFVKK